VDITDSTTNVEGAVDAIGVALEQPADIAENKDKILIDTTMGFKAVLSKW